MRFLLILNVSFVVQMAEAISTPLSNAQKITMVSSGGSEVGASKLAGEVLDIMTRVPGALEKLTGVDISQVFCSPAGETDLMIVHHNLSKQIICLSKCGTLKI